MAPQAPGREDEPPAAQDTRPTFTRRKRLHATQAPALRALPKGANYRFSFSPLNLPIAEM